MNAQQPNTSGHLMAREARECFDVFANSSAQDILTKMDSVHFDKLRALYTIARGSSDAAANILSYELMRETGIPVTSLPPSVFSLGGGVRLSDAALLVISQSGASTDLVASAQTGKHMGASILSITNKPGSAVEQSSDVNIPIGAGPELAVPATKSVVGSIAAGAALISAISSDYKTRATKAANVVSGLSGIDHPDGAKLRAALLRSQHVYVIGRDTGFGAAHEVALKLKECCALHAEAYSASEVLHGPLQLVTRPLTILLLDTEQALVQDSLDTAETRFLQAGGAVIRVRPSDIGARDLTPAAAASVLLGMLYPVILQTALALGHNPDAPETLAKETLTT